MLSVFAAPLPGIRVLQAVPSSAFQCNGACFIRLVPDPSPRQPGHRFEDISSAAAGTGPDAARINAPKSNRIHGGAAWIKRDSVTF